MFLMPAFSFRGDRMILTIPFCVFFSFSRGIELVYISWPDVCGKIQSKPFTTYHTTCIPTNCRMSQCYLTCIERSWDWKTLIACLHILRTTTIIASGPVPTKRLDASGCVCHVMYTGNLQKNIRLSGSNDVQLLPGRDLISGPKI